MEDAVESFSLESLDYWHFYSILDNNLGLPVIHGAIN